MQSAPLTIATNTHNVKYILRNQISTKTITRKFLRRVTLFHLGIYSNVECMETCSCVKQINQINASIQTKITNQTKGP